MSAYLVRYGRSAFVGRFLGESAIELARGDRAVVRTPRGLELGYALGRADERFAATIDPAAGGELIRRATPEDEQAAERSESISRSVLSLAEGRVGDGRLPVSLLDAETLLDGTTILHILPWTEFDADSFAASVGVTIRLHDVSRTPTAPDPPTGCGKPGCGTTVGGCSSCGPGGGCSTGGCSKGSVKSANELTSYFADLRAKMEARRTSLH